MELISGWLCLGINPEDLDLIQPQQQMYCSVAKQVIGRVDKLESSVFADHEGELIITQAGEVDRYPGFFVVRWNGSGFEAVFIAHTDGNLEHTTFAPIDLVP